LEYVKSELPYKIPEVYNNNLNLLKRYIGDIISPSRDKGAFDLYVRNAKNNLVNNVLSFNLGVIGLNFMQRQLSSLYVSPRVFFKVNGLMNQFNARIKMKQYHPHLDLLLSQFQLGSRTLFMESIQKFLRLDPSPTENKLLAAYGNLTKISTEILEHSPFMSTERPNWGISFMMGAVQYITMQDIFKQSYEYYLKNTDSGKNVSFWMAIEEALDHPEIQNGAMQAGQIVNAATNVDPSVVFAPAIFSKSNVLSDLLIFWRFTMNMANIIGLDLIKPPGYKSNFSPNFVNLMLYGNDEEKRLAAENMVLNNICNSFSKANLDKVFKQEEKIAGFSKQDMLNMGEALRQMRDGYKEHYKNMEKDMSNMLGGRLTAHRWTYFLSYMMVSFMLTLLASKLSRKQRKSIGQYLVKPENRKAFLRNEYYRFKDEDKRALLNAINLNKMISSKGVGTGIFPEVNIYNTTQWKSLTRTVMRWAVTISPPTSWVDIPLRCLTGIGLEEMIYYNLIYNAKKQKEK